MSKVLLQKRNETCFQNGQGFSKATTAVTPPTQPPPPKTFPNPPPPKKNKWLSVKEEMERIGKKIIVNANKKKEKSSTKPTPTKVL